MEEEGQEGQGGALMPVPDRKRALKIVAPGGAQYWTLVRNRLETKGKSKHTRGDPCKWPEPGPDGEVLTMFPVAQFSLALVLQTWGPGGYRVEWYDGKGEHMRGHGSRFEVQNKSGGDLPERARRRRRSGDAGDEAGDEGRQFEGVPVRRDGSIGMLDVFSLMQAQRERDERREELRADRLREEARAQRESDRNFFALMMQGGAGGARGQVDLEALARTMNLSMREQLLGLREELGLRRQEERDQEPPGDDERDPVERIVGALVGELEEQLPGALQELLPALVETLKQRGYKPSAAVRGVVKGIANGAGHANGG